jgi:hypothetical protein
MQMSCLIYLDNFHDMAAFTVNRTFGVRQSYEEFQIFCLLPMCISLMNTCSWEPLQCIL